MTPTGPPKRLPAAYGEIWTALREADEKAASRQVLARQLGISTATVQRILVRGEVPNFSRRQSTRVVRAWAGTIARLAHHFHRDPRAWIEAAGIRWDEAIADAVDASYLRLMRRREYLAGRGGAAGSVLLPVPPAGASGPTAKRPRRACGETVVVGLGGPDSLSVSEPGQGVPFLEAFARRLFATIDPAAKLLVRPMRDQDLAASLATAASEVRVGIGVLESVHREALGLGFVGVPGWEVPLTAIRLRRREDGSCHSWREMLDPLRAETRVFLTPAHDVAAGFLSAQCGIPPGRLVTSPDSDPARLLRALLRETVRRGRREIFLVTDVETCRRVRDLAKEQGGIPGRFVIEEPADPGGEAPRYPLALALRRGDGWRRLLEKARDRELFGRALRQTARLYADALGSRSGSVLRLWNAGPLVKEHPGFVEALAELTGAPATGRTTVAVTGTPFPALHCRSCAASLREEHNRGVSDRYCRYCSDERGELRPRQEVQRILARWLADWQGGISAGESMRRAALLMSAMPAWSEN